MTHLSTDTVQPQVTREPFHVSRSSDGERQWFSARDPASGVTIPAKDRDDAYALVSSLNRACLVFAERHRTASTPQAADVSSTASSVDPALQLVAGYADYKAISDDRWEQGKAAGYRELGEIVAAWIKGPSLANTPAASSVGADVDGLAAVPFYVSLVEKALQAYIDGSSDKTLTETAQGIVSSLRNPCDKIFDHKWLDPECVETGCQSLVWKSRYEAAVKGRQEFRQAFRDERKAPQEMDAAPDTGVDFEGLGDALAALSGKLLASDFLNDDANHRAYEKVVAEWLALTKGKRHG